MNKLDISTIEYFSNRFYQCYDSIIRCISLITTETSNTSKAQVILSVRDEEGDGDGDGWVNLKIKIEGFTEFIGTDIDNYNNEVLSDGIKVGFFDDLIYLDFEPFTDEPEGVEDFKKSKCLLIGKDIFWKTTSYSEKC
jgi:hypothetical protein